MGVYMRVAVSWRRRRTPPGDPQVFEIVVPRTNTAALSSAEHLFASIALDEPCSLEIAADQHRRQFLMRASSERMRQQLLSQLGAADQAACLRGERGGDHQYVEQLDERRPLVGRVDLVHIL